MPNILVHFGVQGVVTRSLMWQAEPRWIFLGCLIPDIPWILQRLGSTFIPGIDLYDLRLYAIVQASLAVSLLLCGALAQLSSRASEVFNVLALQRLPALAPGCVRKPSGRMASTFLPPSPGSY